MALFYIFLVFIFGLLIGSFLNAVIHRLDTGESITTKRSHCVKCGHILAWYELIPVISFLIQRRSCRSCGQRISWQYPIVEISTGLIFLLIFSAQGGSALGGNFLHFAPWASRGEQFLIFKQFLIFEFLNLIYFLTIASFLIIIFVYDLKHYIISDKIIFPAIGIAFLYRVFEFFNFNIYNLFRISDFGFRISAPFVQAISVAILVSLFFFSIFAISRGAAMGFGDAKLAFLMGLFLGWPNILVALFIAFVVGGIIGVGLIAAGKKKLKSQIPFGPFLVFGTLVAILWGSEVISWYTSLIL